VYLYHAAEGLFVLHGATGVSDAFAEAVGCWPHASLRGQLVAGGSSFYLRHGELPGTGVPAIRAEGLRALGVIPLLHGGKVVGCVNLGSRRCDEFSAAARRRAERSVTLLAPVIWCIIEDEHTRQSRDDIIRLLDSIRDGLFILDREGKVLWANGPAAAALGYGGGELVGMNVQELHPPEGRDEASRIAGDMRAGQRQVCRIPLLRKDGSVLPVETTVTLGHWQGREAIFGITRDMTEAQANTAKLENRIRRRTANLARRLQFERFVAANSRRFVAPADLDSAIQASLAELGERLAADRTYVFEFDDDSASMNNTFEWCAAGIVPYIDELKGLPQSIFPWWIAELRAGRSIFIAEVSTLPPEASAEREILQMQGVKSLVGVGIHSGAGLLGFLGMENCMAAAPMRKADVALLEVFADILGDAIHKRESERILAQERERLRTILGDTDALICRFQKDGILSYVNEAYCQFFGLAREQLVGKDFLAFIPEELRPGVQVKFLSLTPANPSLSYEHQAIRCDGELRWQRWTDRALFAPDGGFMEYQSVGIDITDYQRATGELRSALAQLEETVESMVHGLSRTMEARDPYTAGHQRRVAELARAIAQEMGKDAEFSRMIYYGALLHDIGKASIPSEILSKPGALTAIEHMLLRCHAEYGAKILREIKFPWPLWRTAASHHERLDGSGYPAGLKGEEIPLEARIVAVADVVESMVSHRPYRSALPVAEAMAEIRQGSGRVYDATVVAAFLRLWNQGGSGFVETVISGRAW
jgi:PAS domain S-box-containing protein/putative nucleotidyltransferase with HDIG domain